jgi:hypothetical protein
MDLEDKLRPLQCSQFVRKIGFLAFKILFIQGCKPLVSVLIL